MIVIYQSNSFWAYFVCSYTFGKKISHVKDIKWLQKYQEDPTSRLQSWAGVPCLIWRTKVDMLTSIFYFLHTHFERFGFLFCIGNMCYLLSSLSLKSKCWFSGQTSSDFGSIPSFFPRTDAGIMMAAYENKGGSKYQPLIQAWQDMKQHWADPSAIRGTPLQITFQHRGELSNHAH